MDSRTVRQVIAVYLALVALFLWRLANINHEADTYLEHLLLICDFCSLKTDNNCKYRCRLLLSLEPNYFSRLAEG